MFEGKTEYLDILLELFLEIYGQFEEEEIPKEEQIKEIIYWYASDYCDVFVADRIREQIDPDCSFALNIICVTIFRIFGIFTGSGNISAKTREERQNICWSFRKM